MTPSILVVGSINMDLVIKTPRIPLPGQNVFGEEFRTIPGGKGANQAVGVARLGCASLLAGRVGRDTFGDTLLHSLRSNGVDMALVERDDGASTGIALILVDHNGENCIVIATGANGRFSKKSAARLKKTIGQADLVLLQLEIPLDPVAEVIDMACALGKRVVLDAGPPCREPRRSFFNVTVLTPNEAEAQALCGRTIKNMASTIEAARHLLDRGPEAVVLKLGAEGSLLATPGREKHFPAHEVAVVDTTAAGDAFSAALSVAMVEGRSLDESVEFANAAGALAVTKLGAQPSLPTSDELEHFLLKR